MLETGFKRLILESKEPYVEFNEKQKKIRLDLYNNIFNFEKETLIYKIGKPKESIINQIRLALEELSLRIETSKNNMEKLYTIEEMIKIDSNLELVVTLAKELNQKAKGKRTDRTFAKAWVDYLKPEIINRVGSLAYTKKLEDYRYLDIWHNHLVSITPNLI